MSIELIKWDKSVPVSVGLYSDNTPMVKFAEGVDPTDFDTMVLRHETTTEFVAAMFLCDSIYERGGKVKNLILPYIPGARQDRVNPTGDTLFAAKSFVDMINWQVFEKVVVIDPHSPVSLNSIEDAVEYPLSEVASRMWKGYTGIIAPDKGAKSRAEIFAEALDIPIYYASKTRDVSTGRLSGFSVDIPEGGHYLVADDICDGGGTFVGLGEKIKEAGSFADLYVTHGIFAKGTRELKNYYKNIYTTDSLPKRENADVLVVPVVERMKNYV